MVTTHTQDVDLTQLIEQEIALNVIDAEIVLDWVRETFEPEEIFEKDELAKWALDNGFVNVGALKEKLAQL